MATQTATDRTYHGTAPTGTADTVNFPLNFRAAMVYNRDATNPIWVRADGTAAAVGASGSYVVPPNGSILLDNRLAPNEPAISVVNVLSVSVIASAGTPAFDIQA